MAKFSDDRCLGAVWGQTEDLWRFKGYGSWINYKEAVDLLEDQGFTTLEAADYLMLLKYEYISVYMGNSTYEE